MMMASSENPLEPEGSSGFLQTVEKASKVFLFYLKSQLKVLSNA
jgi:hypothetical protein